MNDREMFWKVVKVLPSDYLYYGGTIDRWADPEKVYPDCSSGCRYFKKVDADWGICTNADSPRAGLLTFEHMAGDGCFNPRNGCGH
jgi:hypothetical protein